MIEQSLIETYFQSNPQAYQLFITLLLVIGAAQRYLGPEDDWVEGFRRRWLIRFHELLSAIGAFGIAEVAPRGEVGTINVSDEDVSATVTYEDHAERKLYQMGFCRNVLASKKYRNRPEGRQWSASSWVYRSSLFAPRQTHVTLFSTDETGVFVIYAHEEPSNVRHPLKHLASNAMDYENARLTVIRLAREGGVSITKT